MAILHTHVSESVCSSEMLSFSFNPEILSFFGETNNDFTFEVPGLHSPLTSLRIIIPRAENGFTVFSLLHYSVVTSGVVVLVGIGSYCAYQKLQQVNKDCNGIKIACFGWSNRLASRLNNIFRRLRTLAATSQTNQYSDLVPFEGEQIKSIKRSLDLQLSSNRNELSRNRNHTSKQDFNARNEMFKCDLTPVITDIAMGDEDGEEIQCRYFGPAGMDQQKVAEDSSQEPNDRQGA